MSRAVGSLCSGYGGLDMALDVTPAWHVETCPDASAVLARHHPGVPNLGDLRTVRWRDVTPVDVLTAGFPCQPVSAAGRRGVDDDPRWLWPHVRRAIRGVRPPEVFLENVEHLVSIRGGAILAGILSDLRALGYAARWCVLGACAVGLAHHRHRWFLRAERVTGRAPAGARVPVVKCGARRGGGVALLPTPAARDGDHRGEGSADYWARRRHELGRVNGLPLGAVVGLLPTPRATDGKNGGPNQRGSTADDRARSPVDPRWFGRYAIAIAVHADATGVGPPPPTEPNGHGQPRLSPAFAEWLMGLPAGWVTGDTDRVPALRIIGNGVAAAAAAAAAWRTLGGAP